MSINRETMVNAAMYVRECDAWADIHTVTLITNGHTGKVDVKIEGFARDGDSDIDLNEPYERTFNVNG